MGEADPDPFLTPPCTIEIRGEKTESDSPSSGPSSVLGRPRFRLISPLMLTNPPVLLFSGLAPGLEVTARPIMVIGGGPGPSLGDTLGAGSLGSFSSPETSARPLTFRFSAVLSNEDSRS